MVVSILVFFCATSTPFIPYSCKHRVAVFDKKLQNLDSTFIQSNIIIICIYRVFTTSVQLSHFFFILNWSTLIAQYSAIIIRKDLQTLLKSLFWQFSEWPLSRHIYPAYKTQYDFCRQYRWFSYYNISGCSILNSCHW